MKQFFSSQRTGLVLALSAIFHLAAAHVTDPKPVMHKGDIQLKSLTSITFSKEGVLFLADPLGMKIYALDEKQMRVENVGNLEVSNIDEKVAALMGVSTKDIKIEDMAVNPTSREVYLAVSRRGSSLQPAIIKLDKLGFKPSRTILR